MNAQTNANKSKCGFTRVELAVLITLIALVAFIGFTILGAARNNAAGINCINHLKQVGLAFRLWSGDNNDLFPMQVSTNAGGTKEFVARGTIAPHFLVMSNELESPAILSCPGDKEARVAASWQGLTDANISYFVALEADETIPRLWLSGDSDFTTNSIPVKRGVITVKESLQLSWTAKRHSKVGNLVFTDGRVEELVNLRLNEFVINALRAYYEATTNTSFRLAIP